MSNETVHDNDKDLELYKKELEVSAYKREIDELKRSIENLNKSHSSEVDKLNFEIETKDLMIENAKQMLKKMQRALFDSGSEKASTLNADIDDMFLFDEADLEQPAGDDAGNEPEKPEEKDKGGRKKHPGYEDGAKKRAAYRKQALTTLPPDTATVKIDHTAEIEAPVDPVTGKKMVKVDARSEFKVSRIVKYIVEEHIFPVFAPAEGYIDDNGSRNLIVGYPGDDRVLRGCMIEERIPAEICADKYVFGMPLDRLAERYRQSGVMISKQNMVHWLHKLAKEAEPLMKLLKKKLLSSPLINMDETPHRVLTGENGLRNVPGRFEIVQVGTGDGYQVVVYSFNTGRSAESLSKFLEDYKGALMTDGLSGYAVIDADKLNGTDFLRLSCWAHARRYFFDVAAVNKKSPCAMMIKHIGKLYAIEKELRAKWDNGGFASKEEFSLERINRTRPVFAAIKAWIAANYGKFKNGSLEAKAMNYALNRWDALIAYPQVFESSPDNNLCERFTRNFSLGNKAWYFSDTVNGAETSSAIFTLAQNALLSGINVYDYFWTLLRKLPSCRRDNNYEQLLPWNIDLSEAENYRKMLSAALPNPDRTEPYVIRGGLY